VGPDIHHDSVYLSKYFDQIVEEVIELGFGRGATYINPETGKPNQRFVDFNSGLDANLLTPQKAAQLLYLEATEYLRTEGRAMIVANELILAKLKSGPTQTAKLRRMVDVYVVRKSYRPRRRPISVETLAA